MTLNLIELCAGGGGQALGLEMAGFHHAAAVEYEPQFCTTLRNNRPRWNVIQQDIRNLRPSEFTGLDLLAAGVPCPPFSIAGKQLGSDDERDMFPAVMSIIKGALPRGILFENVQGLATAKFSDYRNQLMKQLRQLGYQPEWRVLQASAFGVPQLRPRFVMVALKPGDAERFRWPAQSRTPPTVGKSLVDLMAENGWPGANIWADHANRIAPTVVGGSKKHGGPDLGPTRAKQQWKSLRVDGMGIADQAPSESFPINGMPRLTVKMVARVQGFPDTWQFSGKKTVAYRQVGNAFPPPVARAVGRAIIAAFKKQLNIVENESELELRLLEQASPYIAQCQPKKVRKH